MKIRFLKELCLRDLKNDYLKNDYSKESFAGEFLVQKGRENYYEEINIEVEYPNLIISKDPKYDYENAKLIYEALKHLPTIYARKESLWSYLTHFEYWDYMKERWYNNKSTTKNGICSRYFFFGKTSNDVISVSSKPYTLNGIGRLWWGAYIVYNEKLNDPYEYLPELFITQDLFVGICERSVSKNKALTTSILKMVRKYKLNKVKNSTRVIRECLKEINFEAAITMFDILDEKEIDDIVENIVISKLNEFSSRNIFSNIFFNI